MLTESPDEVSELPTARHDDDDGHATALRKLSATPAGFGMRSIRQRRPFHRSANVVGLPEPPAAVPTAVHAERALHATPSRLDTRAPAGFGVAWTRHPVPSHRSAKVTARFEDVS